MLVKPREAKEGQLAMIVRDPRSRIKLPPEGAKVPDTSYWLRRLKCGDVVKTTAEDIASGLKERLAKEAKDRADSMAKPKDEAVDETEKKSPDQSKQKHSSKGRR